MKEAPAVELGVIEKRWSLEQVVDMVDDYFEAKELAKFEEAFQRADFSKKPHDRLPHKPVEQKQLTPWYLDPESGGPNPETRKPGIAYEGENEWT